MKVLLMHPDRDFDLQQELPWNESALTQDLELDTLLCAMAGDDRFVCEVTRKALLSGLWNDAATVLHRQAVLKDCLKNPAVVRDLYDLAVKTIERRRTNWLGIVSRYPAGILSDAIALLEMLIDMLRELRDIGRAQAGRCPSAP